MPNKDKNRGRPPNVPIGEIRRLHALGKKNVEIEEILRDQASARSISRYINQQQNGARLEGHLLNGQADKANNEIPQLPSAEQEPTSDNVIGHSDIPLELDSLHQLGVPPEQAPIVMACWDLARWAGHSSVLSFWRHALAYLEEDRETPWDVCIDLALERVAGETIGPPNPLVALLWRYKPWRGRVNARAYLDLVRSGLWEMEAESGPRGMGEKVTARDMYVLLHRLPRRLINNYIEQPLGFPLSLLLRGRKREPPISAAEASDMAARMGSKWPEGENHDSAV